MEEIFANFIKTQKEVIFIENLGSSGNVAVNGEFVTD